MAEESSKDPKLLSRVIAEEEYGLREEALVSPRRAALVNGLSYVVGAAVPLVPYLLGLPIVTSILLSLLLAGAALAFTGVLVAVLANVSMKGKVLELLIAGLGSAAIAFALGRIASELFHIEVE